MRNFFLLVFTVVTFTITQAYAHQHKIDSLLKALPNAANDQQRIDMLNSLAFEYTLISVTEAEKFVSAAINLAGKTQYKKGLAESLKIQGVIHYVKNEYTVAIEKNYSALKYYEELQDKSGQSKVLNNLAMLYNAQKDFQRAYTLSKLSILLKREIGDSLGVANSMLLQAEYYVNSGNHDRALAVAKEALHKFQILHSDPGISYAYLRMGEIYHHQKNFTFASSYYRDAMQYAHLANDNMQVIAISKCMGQLFMDMQKLDSSKYYLRKTIRLAHEKSSRSHELDAIQLLAKYFEIAGELDSALYYTKMGATLEREVFDHQRSEQMASIQMLYDFQKKEQELNFQKNIVRRQYVAIVGVILILVCAIVLGFKFYALNKTNREGKESLERLNADIHKMNENLELLVQERTEELAKKNERLVEYAFFTAHEVRGPLARIMGLVELSRLNETTHERDEIMARLTEATNELDEVIRLINRKLENSHRI